MGRSIPWEHANRVQGDNGRPDIIDLSILYTKCCSKFLERKLSIILGIGPNTRLGLD